MGPTCFGLRPSSGSLKLNLAKIILILRHSARLLFDGVAACQSVTCVLCAVQSTAHSTQVTFNINLARLNCKLPDYRPRPKHVGTI